MNQQPDEEIHKARSWTEEFSILMEFEVLPCGTWKYSGSPTGDLSEPLLLGFYGGFITQAWLIKSLAIGDWFNLKAPLHSPEIRGWYWKFWPSRLIPLAASPHPQVLSKSHFISINPVVVERDLLWIENTHFTFMAPKLQKLRARD